MSLTPEQERDFETVQKDLVYYDGPVGDSWDALDRLRSDLEAAKAGLDAVADQLAENARLHMAEVERLRQHSENLGTEVLRLREELEGAHNDYVDAMSEAEQLREELTQGLGPLSEGLVPMTPVEAYRAGTATMEAEVERLDEELLEKDGEIERLRAELDAERSQSYPDLAAFEIARLQDKVRNLEATLVAQIKGVVNGTED